MHAMSCPDEQPHKGIGHKLVLKYISYISIINSFVIRDIFFLIRLNAAAQPKRLEQAQKKERIAHV